MKTAHVLVIAYGNPLRGDDGVAWRAADELVNQFAAPEVEVLRCHQLAPELADKMAQFETVIFIDAKSTAVEGTEAGEVGVEPIHPQDTLIAAARFSHQLSPATLLSMAALLYGALPRAYVATITGENFEPGEVLSPAVARALPELLKRIEAVIGDLAHA
jgi:hydrogenase maturation protease